MESLFFLLTIGTAFTFFWLMRSREALRLGRLTAICLAVLHTLVGVGCVKVFAVLETLSLDNAGKMSLFGAVFFLPLVYWAGAKLTKRSIPVVFDVFTPCMVFTLLCARVNCILSGCCQGRYVPWVGGDRWPTREAEILFYVVFLLLLLMQERKQPAPGRNYPVYMIAYGAFRFLTEGFRSSDSGSIIHISHLWAAVTFCLGLSIYSEMQRKKNKQNARRKQRA